MKKFCWVLVLALIIFTFASCDAGRVRSSIEITSINGAGTKTIICHVLKDDAEIPEYPGSQVGNNSPYFPNGMEAARDLLQNSIAEGFTVDMTEEDDRYIFTITYSFESIDDYNAKTKMLIGQSVWDENAISDSTLTVSSQSGGSDVTFTEDPDVLVYSVRWAALALLNDTTGAYDPNAVENVVVTVDNIMQTFETQVTIGDTTQVFIIGEAIDETGFISDPSAEETTEPETTAGEETEPGTTVDDGQTNPVTGDNIYIYTIVALLALLSLTVMLRSRKIDS
jgi:hypothetical protein